MHQAFQNNNSLSVVFSDKKLSFNLENIVTYIKYTTVTSFRYAFGLLNGFLIYLPNEVSFDYIILFNKYLSTSWLISGSGVVWISQRWIKFSRSSHDRNPRRRHKISLALPSRITRRFGYMRFTYYTSIFNIYFLTYFYFHSFLSLLNVEFQSITLSESKKHFKVCSR